MSPTAILLASGKLMGGPKTLRLLAARTFYAWMRFLYFPTCGSLTVDALTYVDFDRLCGRTPAQDYRLLKVPDPRECGLPHPRTYHSLLSIPYDDARMEEGHYILIAVLGNKFVACSPAQFPPAITHSLGQNRVTRKIETRKAVRLRDRQCRITGTAAKACHRGLNVTGLEVAHVYPLGEADNSSSLTTRQPSSNWTVKNAWLLRADVHPQFDAYEIGIEVIRNEVNGITLRIRVFEKDAAVSINQDISQWVYPPAGIMTGQPDANPHLLVHHYLMCLLWHVAGNGRPSTTQAVEVQKGLLTGHELLR
ncbi:hypothetical protein B0H13DRAFT_1899155 [Mycena leptocephala]|nr:hypothetical protein B0H13DRAFT_1899155 [Mycena leptocephala]